MVSFSLKKILLSLLSTTIIAPVSFLSTTTATEAVGKQELIDAIKNNSFIIGQKEVLNYQDHEFDNEQTLNNYIANQNTIEAVQTTSNPGKIIDDYQFHTLDATKIYDTNFDNFQFVFRDAYGNASLSKEAALKTYVNNSSVSPSYSYDKQHWADSPEEAKSIYTFKTGLSKSLYYFIDGRYYNAFNPEDQKALKLTLLEGYNINHNNEKVKFNRNDNAYGTAESLYNVVHDEVYKTWVDAKKRDYLLNYSNFVKINTNHTIRITPANQKMIKITKNGVYNEYHSNSTAVIDDLSNVINSSVFKSGDGWSRSKGFELQVLVPTFKWKYHREFISGNDKYQIDIEPEHGNVNVDSADIDFSAFTVDDSYNSSLELYNMNSQADAIKGNQVNNQNVMGSTKLHEWTNIQLNMQSPANIPSQYVLDMFEIWFKDFYYNHYLTLNPQDSTLANNYGVSTDLLYDINGQQGYKYSLKANQNKYDTEIKPAILANPIVEADGTISYKIRTDLYVTKEQLDNYMFLEGNTIDTRLMYNYRDDPTLSSLDGSLIFNNELDAREEQFEFEAGIIWKRYVITDAFGNEVVSYEGAEDAINKTRQQIVLTGKLINKDEIASWPNGQYSFENIIQDGIYTVYRIYNDTRSAQGLDPYIYFDNYESALEAIKNGVVQQDEVKHQFIDIKLFVYVDSTGNSHHYTYSKNEEIDQIANQILTLTEH